MDLEDLSSIEFLDLSDVDIKEQSRIRTSLQQYDPSVQLPWIKHSEKTSSNDQLKIEESLEEVNNIPPNSPIHYDTYAIHPVISTTIYYTQQPPVVVQPILTYSPIHPPNIVYYANPGTPISPPYPHVIVPQNPPIQPYHQSDSYSYSTASEMAVDNNFDDETLQNGEPENPSMDTEIVENGADSIPFTTTADTVIVENGADPTPVTATAVHSVIPNGEANINSVSPVNKSWASLFSSNKTTGVSGPPPNGGAPNLAVHEEPNNNLSLCPIKHPRKSQNFIDPDCYRMGEYLSLHNLDGKSVSLQPRGLVNQSNFCYINSILQALIACPPLFNLMSGLAKNISSNEKRKPTPVIDGMCRLVKMFRYLPPLTKPKERRSVDKNNKKELAVVINTDIPFEPTWIFKMLNGIRTDLIEGRQEDAEEFLGFLLNGLNDEMLGLMKLVKNDIAKPQVGNRDAEIDDDEWQVMGSKNKCSVTRRTDFEKTPIREIFGGLLKSKIVRQGDLSTENIQPFLTLQLNIEKVNTVREALDALVNKNQLEGLTSSKTNQEVEAWQQVLLEELPVILILHLKCFDFRHNGCTKIIKALEFPVDLKIDSKLLSSKTQTLRERQYKLFAVVYHDGKEASKGHYLTDAFHVGYGSWLRYDDATVKTVTEEQVLKPQGTRVPYLLFYRRADTIRAK